MATSEASFSAEIRYDIKSVYGDKIFVYLLPNMMMTLKKPFDFQVIYKSRFYAFECKYVKGSTLNVVNSFKPHQPRCLREVTNVGGFAYFLVCFHKYDTAILMSPDIVDYITEKECSDSLKFESLKEVVGHSGIIERKKFERKRWDVERVFGND